jgi:hypothetical protein
MIHRFFHIVPQVILLGIATLVLSCTDPTLTEQDVWSDDVTVAQLDGTWRGHTVHTTSIKKAMGTAYTNEMEALYGDITITTNMDSTYSINARNNTIDGHVLLSSTYSGGNIATVWPIMKASIGNEKNVSIHSSGYGFTLSIPMATETISDDQLSGIQINQSQTKFKLISTVSDEKLETIFIKQ